jgi:hypothetical protein
MIIRAFSENYMQSQTGSKPLKSDRAYLREAIEKRRFVSSQPGPFV